ncbi:hypothetical protein DLM78_19795 [Leptospira stimsonii]|uniref:Uncharacterized protein n=1 Tax=Leptospira stimsonii TaxID=2202203 RepID=A0A8B3CL55_9LEPT|nr:hypothetical protein DLM78_19795 [Leptospira stimsonii]
MNEIRNVFRIVTFLSITKLWIEIGRFWIMSVIETVAHRARKMDRIYFFVNSPNSLGKRKS